MTPRPGDGGGSDNRPCFFKFFYPDLTAERLRIPAKFSKHIASDPGVKFSLEGPGGSSWAVELVKSGDGVFIESGWKEFVADHCITVGDFLLFHYAAPSSFTVMVFDNTNCEKEESFLAWPTRPASSAQNHLFSSGTPFRPASETAGPASPMDPCRARRRLARDGLHSNFSYHYGRSFSKSGHCDDRSRGSSLPQIAWLAEKHSDTSPMQQPFKKNKGSKQKSESSGSCLALVKCSEGNQDLVPRRTLLSQRRPVTREEMDRTIEISKAFKSANPFFAVVMQDAYVYNSFFLHIPSTFVLEYLPLEKTEMNLWSPHGKAWPVIYLCYAGKRGFFSGGWGKFSVAHNLEKGDVCVFEMVEQNNLRVHIFRVVEELTPLIRIGKTRNTIVTPEPTSLPSGKYLCGPGQ